MVSKASGSPLTQVLVHASHFCHGNEVDHGIIQLLVEKADLNVRVWCHGWFLSPVELAIELKRLDLAKLMVQENVDLLIDPDFPKIIGVAQVFDEYFEFGTNDYFSWLLHEYLPSINQDQIFIKKVVSSVHPLFNKTAIAMFADANRHPVHAILTCRHEEMIKMFLEQCSTVSEAIRDSTGNISGKKGDPLTIQDGAGRSALEIAAAAGDLDSVKIL